MPQINFKSVAVPQLEPPVRKCVPLCGETVAVAIAEALESTERLATTDERPIAPAQHLEGEPCQSTTSNRKRLNSIRRCSSSVPLTGQRGKNPGQLKSRMRAMTQSALR